MDIYNRRSNYDKSPEVTVQGFDSYAWEGYEDIMSEIQKKLDDIPKTQKIIVVECYPGVAEQEVWRRFQTGVSPVLSIQAENASLSEDEIRKLIGPNLTEDRVFGIMSHFRLEDFFSQEKLTGLRKEINEITEGVILIYGTGATLLVQPDVLIYADLARWEIQQRFRNETLGNWKSNNLQEDILKKYKQAFFVDWRVADRHKKGLYSQLDYVLDTNIPRQPKLVTGDAFKAGLKQTVQRPFRVVPFFDPGVWGGQWMKEVCDLDRAEENYAWCFDCVLEENSLYLRYGKIRIEVPAINLVFFQSIPLLGEKVYARFGAEFPIRFDFLDTMGGQNLSLQVHPTTEYIQETFGMHYTQDESYYVLDAGENAVVYLGLQEGVCPRAMLKDLGKAQTGESSFPDELYINAFPAQKHDHFSIPAGTIHCSGANSMILEISATPYIFTFKLWDWNRPGLDGLPRPIHIEHGKRVIQWNRDTSWVKKNLIDQAVLLANEDGWREEKTGLHELQFIETRRHFFCKPVTHHTHGGVNVINLVEGEEAVVFSAVKAFAPFVIHYAETFIVPAAVGEFIIAPYGKSEGKTIATLKAFVRG